MNLKSIITETADWPKPGINFLDIIPILETPLAFDYCVKQFMPFAEQSSSIVAIESRGFPIGAVLAQQLKLPLVLVRKPNKLPRPVYSQSYTTEYSTDSVEIKQSANVRDYPLIVDDLLATGGTVTAAADLLKNNFAVNLVRCAVIINLSFLPGAELLKQNQIELLSLETY